MPTTSQNSPVSATGGATVQTLIGFDLDGALHGDGGPDPTTAGGAPTPPMVGSASGQHLHPRPDSLSAAASERKRFLVKQRLLGPPIPSDQLAHERLGKPTALAVFASDNLSSSAYATEEILRVLIPVVGVAAFSLVVPLTLAMLAVLALLILSYRQTIKAYPSAGGAYVVTRDNFGTLPAQVAGVALLTDYILTVSVSVAAGSAALASTPGFEWTEPYTLPIAIFFVLLIAAGNLKGVRESGKAFAVPTYFFIANMAVLLGAGIYRAVTGGLPTNPIEIPGAVEVGTPGTGLLLGATMAVVLHAFASGGAAVTGVEAISNGVPAFREPSWKNARSTLVVMGTLLGIMFLGLSLLATKVHPVPFEDGTPTVISQIGGFVYGDSLLGQILVYTLQAGTMLILVLAANTSFADFPRLASFQAGDNFMPRQLTKRGHRLVFSNGIMFLSIAAIVILIITRAKVENLIPLYAVGVFLGFTLSQAGMAKHHVTHKEPGWRVGLVINGAGCMVSALVCVVIAATKFLHGAWVIMLAIPLVVFMLYRLNRQYTLEADVLERDAPTAVTERRRSRHAVVVFIDRLDMAAVRAIQYARTITPDAVSAVHFDIDPLITSELVSTWQRLGFGKVPLDVVSCYDRRLERAAKDVAWNALTDEDTELTVLIPRREHDRVWHRLIHDRTANVLSRSLAGLPHCNVTIVPFHITDPSRRTSADPVRDTARKPRLGPNGDASKPPATISSPSIDLPEGATPIGLVAFREEVCIAGRVDAMRVQPLAGAATLELMLADGSGTMRLVFFGRRSLAGVTAGTHLIVTGRVSEHRRSFAILNPVYEILLTESDDATA